MADKQNATPDSSLFARQQFELVQAQTALVCKQFELVGAI